MSVLFIDITGESKGFFSPLIALNFPFLIIMSAIIDLYPSLSTLSFAQPDLTVCKIDPGCFSRFASPFGPLLPTHALDFYSCTGRAFLFFFSHGKAYLACTWIRCKCGKLRGTKALSRRNFQSPEARRNAIKR